MRHHMRQRHDVPKHALDPQSVGRLDEVKRAEVDRALRYALDIRY